MLPEDCKVIAKAVGKNFYIMSKPYTLSKQGSLGKVLNRSALHRQNLKMKN